MQLIDWVIVGVYLLASMWIGWWAGKPSGEGSTAYFLSGRNMPWWLLGVSMVATTFSADTPNLVTEIVRQYGIWGNWTWWAFLITGMLTVFVYAKLWRNSQVLTDLEFYELRYGGKAAAFLRGFRAIYLGLFFNVMIMASVSLAGIKICAILFGFSPWQTLLIAGSITAAYSLYGGLRSVLLTDLFQFLLAIGGSILAAWYLVDLVSEGKGLTFILEHENVKEKLAFLPPAETFGSTIWWSLFCIPLLVQWWSAWYPGAEPGGGGYIAQRMLAAKDSKNAFKATLFFTLSHYALRPWPWILVALASLVVYPDLQSLATAYPDLPPGQIAHDMAYPAMIQLLPQGLKGILAASLLAAFMSTLSTHLNWGSSYLVLDFYSRFLKPDATELEKVWVGRWATFALIVLASLFSLVLSGALQAFGILLQIGAGTGLIYFLRWFWFRINAYSEITAMAVSFMAAIYFEFIHTSMGFTSLEIHEKMLIGVGFTTVSWLWVTLLTSAESKLTLERFQKVAFGDEADSRPGGKGFKLKLRNQLIESLLAIIMTYLLLFGTGHLFMRNLVLGLLFLGVSAIIAYYLLASRKSSSTDPR